MNGRDMIDDPIFAPGNVAEVSGIIDLSGRPTIDGCLAAGLGDDEDLQEIPDALRCGDNYCGPNANCMVDVDDNEGCVCGEGFAARRTVRRLNT
ncbi:MAG: hypothetical protein GY822_22175 [Deltaproteobacteria bacterium]|nr:hypothetical protein [Deltaproteobacteria bacterium]